MATKDYFTELQPRLLSLAVRLTGAQSEAEELVRRVVEHIRREAPRPDRRLTCSICLIRVLSVFFVNDCRTRRGLPREPLLSLPDCCLVDCDAVDRDATTDRDVASDSAPRSPGRDESGQNSTAHFTRAVQTLPLHDQDMLLLHARGASYEEIAAKHGMTRADVACELRRIRRLLRAILRAGEP